MKAFYFAKRFLEAQDVFAVSFKYTMNGNREYHSIFSVICSLTMNIICLIFFLSLISPLFKHSDPTVNYMKLNEVQDISNISLNSEEFFYAVSVLDKNNKFLMDERILSIVANYTFVINNNREINIKEFPLEFLNCTTNYPTIKKYKLENAFRNLNVINYTCFKHKEKEIILGGKYGTKFYANLQVYIKKCINSTENNNHCRPKEEIDSKLQGAWLEIVYLNSYVDIYNYTSPIQFVLENYYAQIDAGINKLVYQYFSPIRFYNDNNMIYTRKKLYEAPLVESSINDVNLLDEKTGIVCSITLGPAYIESRYFRKYAKIQEICSSTGGAWYVLHFIFYLLRALYKGRELNYYLADSLSIIEKNAEEVKRKSEILRESPFLSQKNLYKDNAKNQVTVSGNNKSNLPLNTGNMKLITDRMVDKKKAMVINNGLTKKNNIYSIRSKNYTFERSTRLNFPIKNSNWRYKYDFISITTLIFCPCLSKSKKLKKEYDYLYKKLENYCDFVKVTKLLMEFKEGTENIRKNINEINKNIRLSRRVLSRL